MKSNRLATLVLVIAACKGASHEQPKPVAEASPAQPTRAEVIQWQRPADAQFDREKARSADQQLSADQVKKRAAALVEINAFIATQSQKHGDQSAPAFELFDGNRVALDEPSCTPANLEQLPPDLVTKLLANEIRWVYCKGNNTPVEVRPR